MTALKATAVFTPASFPAHTYVERAEIGLEQRLRDGLDTAGQIVSLSGPSKSGKTVLVERVVGDDTLIPITGAGIVKAEEVWERILDWIEIPAEASVAEGRSNSIDVGGEAGAGAGLFGVIKGETKASASLGAGSERQTTKTHRRRGLSQVVKEIGGSSYVVLIDDFHYMSRGAQR